jgi:hypothetical protein
MVGETGDDLLVGFMPPAPEKAGAQKPAHYNWLEARTQVILEDRDLDLAWSLSCDAQGDLLSCRLPRQEVSRAYLNYLRACPTRETCPAFDLRGLSLLRSLEKTYQFSLQNNLVQLSPEHPDQSSAQSAESAQLPRSIHGGDGWAIRSANTSSSPIALGQETNPASKQKKQMAGKQVTWEQMSRIDLLSKLPDLRKFRDAFVSTLEIWVEQSDPQGNEVFYSAEPARINLLPLSDNYWEEDAQFRPWHFKNADKDNVIFEECNYLPGGSQSRVSVSILGEPSWSGWHRLDTPLNMSQKNSCGTFKVPTAVLGRQKDQFVFSMQFPTTAQEQVYGDEEQLKRDIVQMKADSSRDSRDEQQLHQDQEQLQTDQERLQSDREQLEADNEKPLRITITIPSDRLRPQFGRPQIHTVRTQPDLAIRAWEVKFPVERAVCTDIKGLQDELNTWNAGTAQWQDGDGPNSKSNDCAKLPASFPEDEANGRVSLVITINRPQLALLPKELHLIRVPSAGGTGVQVATLPNLRRLILPHRLTVDTLSTTQFALRGDNATVIDAVSVRNGDKSITFTAATGADFALVTATTPGTSDKASAKQAPAAPGTGTAGTGTTATGTTGGGMTAAGTSGTGTTRTGTTGTGATGAGTTGAGTGSTGTGTAGAQSSQGAKKKDTTASPPSPKTLDPGSYTILPLVIVGQDAKTKNPLYMPLDVTDNKDKPLIFTVPEAKKDVPAKPDTPACATPCVILPCTTTTCPPATPKPAAAQ